MRSTTLLLLLLPALAAAQTFPPDSGGGGGGPAYDGGAVTNPFLAPDGCVLPGYGFTNDTDAGLCRDDGTGPYGLESIAIQTSDPTDFEYAGIQCSEVGGDPFFCIAAAFDDGANNGASIFWQAIGTTTPLAQIVMTAIDFTGGVTGSVGFNLVAPDIGTPTATLTVTGDGGPVSTTTFGDSLTTFSDPIEGAAGSITNPGFGFSVQPDAGMWITGAAGTVLVQNKDITPDGLGRARLTIGEEAWSILATHDTADTRVAFSQGSSEASAEMRLRQGATADTSNETELYMDPDQIALRVEDGGVNEAQLLLDENSTFVVTLTDGGNVSTTTFSDTETTFSDPIEGADGCTAPMYSFTSDSTEGLCRSGTSMFLTQESSTGDFVRISPDRVLVFGGSAVADFGSGNFDGTQLDGSFTLQANDDSDGDTQEIQCRNDGTPGCFVRTQDGIELGEVMFTTDFTRFTDPLKFVVGGGGFGDLGWVPQAGANNAWNLPDSSGTLHADGPLNMMLEDEFCNGGDASRRIGALGWSVFAGTVSEIAPVAGHPCLITNTADAGTGDTSGLYLAQSTGLGTIIATDVARMTYIFQVDDLTDTIVQVGIVNDSDSLNILDGTYLEFDPALDAEFNTITEAADTRTANATATTVATGTWYNATMIRLSSGFWEFYLGVAGATPTLEFTHSTNLPTVATIPVFRVTKTTAADKPMTVDYWSMESVALTR